MESVAAADPYDNDDDDDDNDNVEGFDDSDSDSSEFSDIDEFPPPDLVVQQHSLFNQEPVPCPICCEERVEEGCALVLPGCLHSFCVECFTLYLEAEVGMGHADEISCPFICDASGDDGGDLVGKRCDAPVGADVLREIMTQERYERLMQQRETAFVRKNADYHHCLTPDCINVVLCKVIDDEEGGAGESAARICDCFLCGHTSCLTCGARPFHAGKTCEEHREEERAKRRQEEEEERIQALRGFGGSYAPRPRKEADRSRASEEAKYDFDIGSGATGEFEVGDALAGVKRCRRCGNGVELREGCLKMKCLCGYRFCYKCGSENAQCGCTPSHHGFTDNRTGGADFNGLRGKKSFT